MKKATQLSRPKVSNDFSIWGYSFCYILQLHARYTQCHPNDSWKYSDFKHQRCHEFHPEPSKPHNSQRGSSFPQFPLSFPPCISPRASRASRNKRSPLSPDKCSGEWPETSKGKSISLMPLKTMIRSNQFHHTTYDEAGYDEAGDDMRWHEMTVIIVVIWPQYVRPAELNGSWMEWLKLKHVETWWLIPTSCQPCEKKNDYNIIMWLWQ